MVDGTSENHYCGNKRGCTSCRDESVRRESARRESARRESARRESARIESARRESERIESARRESERDERKREGRGGRGGGRGGGGGGGQGGRSTSGARTSGGQGGGGEGGESSETETSETLSESGEIDSLPSKAAKDPAENSREVHTPEELEGPLSTIFEHLELDEHHELDPFKRNSQQQETIHQQDMRVYQVSLAIVVLAIPLGTKIHWYQTMVTMVYFIKVYLKTVCLIMVFGFAWRILELFVGSMEWNPTANTYSTFTRMRMSTSLWSKCILKYYFWLLVGSILPKAVALYLADLVRRMIPQLAPCNALYDDVTCSATTSTFISHTECADFSSLEKRQRVVDIDDQYKQERNFSGGSFRIGGGLVSLKKLCEDQFRFTSSVRGNLLEDFVATTTNWERMSIILSILKLWEASPKVGVVENLTLWRGGIYCHALNVREIVEGVLKSPNHFSIFQLLEERRFFVGCGNRGKDEAIPIVIMIIGAVSSYYQLKDDYLKVAYASLVIPIVLAFISLFSHLFTQSCFYWLCTLVCFFQTDLRRGVYIWMKTKGWTGLPYCDDFEPDKLPLEDSRVEVIFLPEGTRKHREGSFGERRSPDWRTFPTIRLNYLNTNGVPWTTITPNVINSNTNIKIKFKLFKDLSNDFRKPDAVIFKMKITHTILSVKSSRVIHIKSDYDRTQPQGKMSTHVKGFNGRATTYEWSVSSFLLFVYLMLMWGKMNHGVLERDKNFMFRTYNHVFSIEGLAQHIKNNNLESYYVLEADQTPQSAGTLSKAVLDLNTSCWNKLPALC